MIPDMLFQPTFFLMVCLPTIICHAASQPDTSSQPPRSTANPTTSAAITCQTGPGDALMDVQTVDRLAALFCGQLQANLPSAPGLSYSVPELPTDLTTGVGGPNYTKLEQEGFVAVFDLALGPSFIDVNNIIHPQGSATTCTKDICVQVFASIVELCEYDSHVIGGYNIAETDCGFWSMYTINCTNNIVNPDCAQWHSKWQPSYTTTFTSTTYTPVHYTNTDNYVFEVTELGTTVTSEVLVSSIIKPDCTEITPLIYTVESTFTGYIPNPTFDGPRFSPRRSSVSNTVGFATPTR